jgi:hypothetical protein
VSSSRVREKEEEKGMGRDPQQHPNQAKPSQTKPSIQKPLKSTLTKKKNAIRPIK